MCGQTGRFPSSLREANDATSLQPIRKLSVCSRVSKSKTPHVKPTCSALRFAPQFTSGPPAERQNFVLACLNAEDGNGEGADDVVAVGFEVAAVGLEAGDEEVRMGLLGGLAECFGDVAAADENVGMDAHFFLEMSHLSGSVADELLFP